MIRRSRSALIYAASLGASIIPSYAAENVRFPVLRQATDFELAFRTLLLVFVAVVMVTTGQVIIEDKIAHIITQSLASILVEAEMLTG